MSGGGEPGGRPGSGPLASMKARRRPLRMAGARELIASTWVGLGFGFGLELVLGLGFGLGLGGK